MVAMLNPACDSIAPAIEPLLLLHMKKRRQVRYMHITHNIAGNKSNLQFPAI